MKKSYIILLTLITYIIFYKIYFIFRGEIMIYIINPLIWIVFFIICYMFLDTTKKEKTKKNNLITMIITCVSLVYVISYYAFGVISGYTNNPYAVSLSGTIINFFSIWLVVVLKEYMRYRFVNIKINKRKRFFYIFIFIAFLLVDINIINILKTQDLLTVLSEELIVPFIQNLLMIYICYVGGPFVAIISSSIILLPSLLFDVVPDYEWYVIMVFNILYCGISYFLVRYIISKTTKNIPLHLLENINIKNMVITLVVFFLLVAFSGGFLPARPVVILTGSMKPNMNPGDMVIVIKCGIENVKNGDIIEYKSDGNKIVHRVVSIHYKKGEIELITKGDANKKIDKGKVTKEEFSGKVKYIIPYIGYPAYLLRNIVNNNNEVNIEQGDDNGE